jgi:methionyl aminopeptidase
MLEEALRTIRSGIRAGEIGRSIQTVATRMNLKPIANLTGHTIERYTVHAGTSLPNIYTSGTPALKAGQICAIEPFVTTNHGAGVVINGKTTNIFSLIARKRTGDKKLDTLLEGIWNRVKTLPFALRHLEGLCESRELESLVLRLVEKRVLRGYAVLVEAKGEFVAQAEHTVVPVEGGAIVLTK